MRATGEEDVSPSPPDYLYEEDEDAGDEDSDSDWGDAEVQEYGEDYDEDYYGHVY
jgi:hypothetical protein